MNIGDDYSADMQIKFSDRCNETPAPYAISSQEIADLLNDLAVRRGWPTITFYRTPKAAALN
ncbi:hypothetical protein [Streptomyces sp. NBC_01320]|uniref:hypothetical protein n=1 Tax=Streptomyces sp. NBC_01320 TaxID=2903824 RepID=UPI002E0EB257|nr:hypothetical protein OG395_48075 [Streptomyces sp. NBC_01320]